MPSESEHLARSAKAMQLIETYLPYTVNIESTVDICKKIGLDDYEIQRILVEGKGTIYKGYIYNPISGEKHFILDAQLSLVRLPDGTLSMKIDGLNPDAYFAQLDEREKALKAAADRKGLAGQVYRDNLRLMDALEKERTAHEQWKAIAEISDRKRDTLLEIVRGKEMAENSSGDLDVKGDIVFMAIFNLYRNKSRDHKDGIADDGFYKYQEILREIYSSGKVLLYRVDELEDRLAIPIKKHLVKTSDRCFGEKMSTWDTLADKYRTGDRKQFLKIGGLKFLESLRELL